MVYRFGVNHGFLRGNFKRNYCILISNEFV